MFARRGWIAYLGYLLVDDRTWGTQYRGPVLIHASKGLYKEYYDYLKSNMLTRV